nr:YscO family type III secretion system apparatus protein [uncultured Noviherbaspirillum sp.]
MKIIEDLLRIKTHRENQAETQLAQASRLLQVAMEAVHKALAELDQAHAAHDARKVALYADLFSRLVQKSDIDIANAELEKMHSAIKECETGLEAARQEHGRAEENREQMRVMYRNAFRAREKYTELSQQAQLERARVELHKEDLELDELPARRTDDEAASPGFNRESVA